jgi:ankyrin repeat protein
MSGVALSAKDAFLSLVKEGKLEELKTYDKSYMKIIDEYGWNPLHWASQRGHENVANYLLAEGCDPNIKTPEGKTALHYAAWSGHAQIVSSLLKVVGVDIPDHLGETPLHLCAHSGQVQTGKILMDHGANIYAQDNDGQTPLHKAAFMGQFQFVRDLLEREIKLVEIVNKATWTPLHCASFSGQENIILELIKKGADINKSTKDGFTSLDLAVKEGHKAVCKVLLQHDADPTLCSASGNALHIAVSTGNEAICRILLEWGSDPSTLDADGFTPEALARKLGKVEVANKLRQWAKKMSLEIRKAPLAIEQLKQMIETQSQQIEQLKKELLELRK